MDNLNFNYESEDSYQKGPTKDELINLFEENEKDITSALNQLNFRLIIGDNEIVMALLHSISEMINATQTMVAYYIVTKDEDDEDDEDDPIDGLIDLSNRLN